ncbi:hypothetical protein VU08_01840 [Desulfobulbus sp. F5]|nr:hypothetical protein [Desulfobulbus sp. F5]
MILPVVDFACQKEWIGIIETMFIDVYARLSCYIVNIIQMYCQYYFHNMGNQAKFLFGYECYLLAGLERIVNKEQYRKAAHKLVAEQRTARYIKEDD